MSVATVPVREGDVLAGKYRVERVLGVGGMGVVVAARHVTLEERVAIKFVLPEQLHNPEAVARFLREARNAVRIRSEHVARVTDVGTLESGAPYMVMEYLEGRDLAAVLEASGPLPVGWVVQIVLQACEALAEAHALGIVHRDLKPSNLFLLTRPDGSPLVKVLDFGISKSIVGAGGDVQITKTSAALGSPAYMAPEQMTRAKDVDARADVWALGVILYELLGGRLPFQGDTVPEVCVRIATEAHAPLCALRPDVPPGVSEIVDRCLAKSPAARFGSVAELARALAPFGPPECALSVRRIEGALAASSPAQPRPSLSDPSPDAAPMASVPTLTPAAALGPASTQISARAATHLPSTGASAATATATAWQPGWPAAAAPTRAQGKTIAAAVIGVTVAVGLASATWLGIRREPAAGAPVPPASTAATGDVPSASSTSPTPSGSSAPLADAGPPRTASPPKPEASLPASPPLADAEPMALSATRDQAPASSVKAPGVAPKPTTVAPKPSGNAPGPDVFNARK
jgi:serine/threonine-protein kinase